MSAAFVFFSVFALLFSWFYLCNFCARLSLTIWAEYAVWTTYAFYLSFTRFLSFACPLFLTQYVICCPAFQVTLNFESLAIQQLHCKIISSHFYSRSNKESTIKHCRNITQTQQKNINILQWIQSQRVSICLVSSICHFTFYILLLIFS